MADEKLQEQVIIDGLGESPEHSVESQLPELDEIEQVISDIKDFRGAPLRDRWKGKKGAELAKAVAESYAQIERFQETELKPEVRQYKQQVVEQLMAEKALQQQRDKAPVFDTEEEALAYQFAERYIIPQIREPLDRMQAEQQSQFVVNQALGYANTKAAQDAGFAEAMSSGAIKNVVDEYGLPPSPKSIDMAYDIYRGRNAGGQSQHEAFSEARGRLADEKSRAALATGGSRSSGPQSQNDLIERMREEIMNPDISPDKAMEIMKKKYKIDIGKPY